MSHPIPNTFTTYALSEEEQRVSMQLNSLNVAFLQNLRAQIAEEKLNLPFTPDDIMGYTQKEAHLKGQLDNLSYILACNEEAQQYHHIISTNEQE